MRFDLTAQQVAAVVAMLGDDEDERLRADMLEGETDLYEIVARLLSGCEDDEGDITALDVQMGERMARKRRALARIETRRGMIARLMDIARLDKLVLPEATVSKRAGKPKLVIPNDEAVPDEFQAIKRTPDKKAISAAFEGADELPNWLSREGARDSITVRRK